VTIVCVKEKVIKKVVAVKPKCPKGYKKAPDSWIEKYFKS
jgi:hypothetical protein